MLASYSLSRSRCLLIRRLAAKRYTFVTGQEYAPQSRPGISEEITHLGDTLGSLACYS
jgi:hypothetical protein